MLVLEDWILAGKIQPEDVTVGTLKSGSKSLTDPIIFQQKLHSHLLNQWLDSLNIRPEVKAKIREVMASVLSYRMLYNSIERPVDTTFLCSWSPVEKDILALIEKSIFMSSSHDDAAYKQAIRQGNQPEEVLAWKPWCDEIASIKTRLVISNPTVDNLQPTAVPASSNTQAPQPCQLDSMVANMGDDETDELTAYTNAYCAGLQRKLSS